MRAPGMLFSEESRFSHKNVLPGSFLLVIPLLLHEIQLCKLAEVGERITFDRNMKLLKSRTASRATPDPDGFTYGSQNENSSTSRKKASTFGIFDNFRKASSSRGLDDEATTLRKKGSYTHSERTDPTDALTIMSENLSVASEEISTALNRTFAIFHTPSMNTAEQERNHNSTEEGHFSNQKPLLNQASLDRLAAIETATNFSDPKNVNLRTQSLKIVEFHSDSRGYIAEEQTLTDYDDATGIAHSEVTFDPDKYLLEIEEKEESLIHPSVIVGNEREKEEKCTEEEMVEVGLEEGANLEDIWNEGKTLSSGRTPSPNEGYISETSSEEEDDDDDDDASKTAQSKVTSPLNSVGGSSTSGSSDWDKGSTGTREISLLDAVFDQESDNEATDDGIMDYNTDGSTVDLGEDFAGTLEGDGTLEGPSSPVSQSSSVLMEEYDEIDGLAAIAGAFVNLVSCNFTELANDILMDDEDDYSADGENEPNASNQQNMQSGNPTRKPISERAPTPPAPKLSSFWSMFGGCS